MGSGKRSFVSFAALMAVLAIAALVVMTATAPAGNRTPTPTLVGLPGPGEVTYGQNVAYTATLPNQQSSTFTHVQFHNPIPQTVANGQTLAATLMYASCPGTLTATEFVCNETSVPANETARVTIVWKTPAAGESVAGCACMTNSSYWTIKEGTGKPGSAGPDTFASPVVSTSLLVVPDPVEAGGYALTACTNPSSQSSLATNPTVGPGNPLATKVCASTVPGLVFDPGLVIEVDEGVGPFNLGVTQTSTICIPAPGQTCASNYTPWTFSPPATLSFTIDNRSLPSGEKIDRVLHNGVDVTSSCTIKVVNSLKITQVTCLAAQQGGWDFG
jgi:hypothetical protein